MRSGIEIVEHRKEMHSNSKWMSARMYKFWQLLALWQTYSHNKTPKVRISLCINVCMFM
jgi:hypothetical protein